MPPDESALSDTNAYSNEQTYQDTLLCPHCGTAMQLFKTIHPIPCSSFQVSYSEFFAFVIALGSDQIAYENQTSPFIFCH
jgi:hypothetical protein